MKSESLHLVEIIKGNNILICNEKKFNKRFNILVKMIKYYIDNEPEKEITMEKLFFDRN